MKARKIAEANGHIEEATKALKTSFFKRKPDYHTASSEYFEAAQCFYVAESLDSAIEYYEKASEMDQEIEAFLGCGQKLEKCALLTLQKREKGCEFIACDFYERASRSLLFANEMNHAAEVLTKAAKSLDKLCPEKGVHYWIKACNLMVNFDRDDFAADTFKNTLNQLIKLGRLQSSIILLERMKDLFTKIQSEHNIYKCYLSIVVLALGEGDLPLAKEYFNKHLQDVGYLRSDEIAPAEDVIKAYEDFNEDALAELQQSQKFNYVEQQVNRVAKMLVIGQPVPIYKREADILIREAKGEEIDIPDDTGLLLSISTPSHAPKQTETSTKKTKQTPAAPVTSTTPAAPAAPTAPTAPAAPTAPTAPTVPTVPTAPVAPAVEEHTETETHVQEVTQTSPAIPEVPAELLDEFDLSGQEEPKEVEVNKADAYLKEIEKAGFEDEFDLC